MSFLLNTGEMILEEVRRHLFVFYGQLSWLLILMIAPLLSYGYIQGFLAQISGGHPVAMFLFFFLLWTLGLWIASFYFWTDYYLDVWIVTNQRIIDIEQKGFFHREVTTFSIDRIEDITVNVNGILATFIKFGDLHAHTAADGHNFVIRQAKDPLHVKDLIMSQVRVEKGELGSF